MNEFHPLLRRQLRKYLNTGQELTPDQEQLFAAISESYNHFDADRLLLERAIDLSSEELYMSNQRLREQAKQNQKVLDSLQDAFNSLKSEAVVEELSNYDPNDLEGIAELFKAEVILRKRAESSLLESESNLSSVIENTDNAINSFDREMRLKTANSQSLSFYEKVYKMPRPKLGTHLKKMLPEKAYHHWKNLLDKVMLGKPVHIEQQFYHNGDLNYLETSLYPIYSRNEIIGVSVFTNDITERKETEIKRQQLVKELEAANLELRDFAYVTSHDLKSPLRAIGSLVNWLAADYRHLFDEAGKDNLRLLESRVKRMYNFIDGMLNYARIGHANEPFKPVDLNALVENLLKHSFPANTGQKIELLNKLPTINCQALKMEQLFLNLIGNALKYNDKEEKVVQIGHQQSDNGYEFYVADNGMGISEDHFDKIFKIFQTLEVRDQTESTGIGLSIVKKIVALHEGKVWVTSEEGIGSSFFFTIPVNRE